MALIQLERVQVGEVGVLPGSVKMISTDNLATVSAAGYINQRVTDVQLSPSDVVECLYSYNTSTGIGTLAFLSPSISNGVITLTSVIQQSGNIIAATTANIGGGGVGPISVAVAGLTTSSVVTASIKSSTNVVSVSKVVATATGFDITFSADPGASAIINYIAFKVAQ